MRHLCHIRRVDRPTTAAATTRFSYTFFLPLGLCHRCRNNNARRENLGVHTLYWASKIFYRNNNSTGKAGKSLPTCISFCYCGDENYACVFYHKLRVYLQTHWDAFGGRVSRGLAKTKSNQTRIGTLNKPSSFKMSLMHWKLLVVFYMLDSENEKNAWNDAGKKWKTKTVRIANNKTLSASKCRLLTELSS